MYVVVNKNLHELYEKLTDVPFITKDSRPMLACFFCCAKLKQCWRFQRKCLESEELFSQMMNEDYERNPIIKTEQLEFCNGFINSPMVHVSIDDGQTDNVVVKEELPDVRIKSERLDDNIGSNEEHGTVKPEDVDNSYQDVGNMTTDHVASDSDDEGLLVIKIEEQTEQESIELELEHLENSYPDVADTTSYHAASDSEDVGPSVENKTEKEEIGKETIGEPDAKKQKLDGVQTNLEKSVSTEQKEDENRNLTCNYCHRNFNLKSDLKRHIRIHTGEKPFKCNVCGSNFRQSTHLAEHMLIHTGAFDFKCEICQRRFKRKSHLQRHIQVHTGEKPFKCDICNSSFRLKDCLIRHYHAHTGEKPFKCEICDRSFRRKEQVESHIRQHSIEKIFKCDMCPRIYTRKSSYTMHIRNYHAQGK